jgi:hypothetical protein
VKADREKAADRTKGKGGDKKDDENKDDAPAGRRRR